MVVGLLLLAISCSLSGCSLLPRRDLPQEPGEPVRARVAGVPFYAQDELQCGPAALAMVLGWSGLAVTPADLSYEVYSPGLGGSLQSALIGAARRHGRIAYPLTGSEALLTEIAAGHPVIVLVNRAFFWYPRWHYAVVIGYDRAKDEVLLHSGLNAEERLSARVFLNIWRRSEYWGLLVLPPDELPATVEQTQWIAAVAGLEKAGAWPAAATGYVAAMGAWGQNFTAWMGLGNSRYRLHDLTGAAEAFRQAARLEPGNGMAFNNLAHVLAEQGKLDDALAAARRAMALGGPLREMFRQTFEEIMSSSAPQ
jgi:hypothetical protein